MIPAQWPQTENRRSASWARSQHPHRRQPPASPRQADGHTRPGLPSPTLTDPVRFDLELFTSLNNEYSEKRLVKQPRQFDPESQAREAQRRGDMIESSVGATGKRLLEVGCGRAGVGRYLASTYDCEVVGIDVVLYDDWETHLPPNFSVVAGDAADPNLNLGAFDVIYSFSVWEHLVHPYTTLANCFNWLNPGGKMSIQAQLHRGPKASHRYREVFFPWPHLLFTPDVFEAYYVSLGRAPMRPAWVNKLTYVQYLDYFDRLGYDVHRCQAKGSGFDDEFYERFHDALSAYPRWDLAHDAIVAVVERPIEMKPATEGADLEEEIVALRNRVGDLEGHVHRLRRRKSVRAADWIGRKARRLTKART